MTRTTCKGCGVHFVALRSDAVTCSPRCRQRYKRYCDQITPEAIKAKCIKPGQKLYPRKKGGKK